MVQIRVLPAALTLAITLLIVLSACEGSPSTTAFSSEPVSPLVSNQTFHAYTHLRPDGNRYVEGRGDIADARDLDINLAGKPQWLVSAPFQDGTLWVAVLEDGRTQAFRVENGQVTESPITPEFLPRGAPPLLAILDGKPILLTAPSNSASPFTHPVPLGNAGRLEFIESNGDLVVWDGRSEIGRLPVVALPDARMLVDEDERVLLLTMPSSRYPHGIVGDSLEAIEITLVETRPTLRVAESIAIPGQGVVEGISPIWADLDSDGEREIIVTVSDAKQGAQIVVYTESGERLAEGPAVGQGNRWRHQIAVAPFGPDGQLELAEVLTPHIGSIAGFYRLDGDSLTLVAQKSGVTSHTIGSRNLDQGLAADFDGDEQAELVVFNQQFAELAGLRRIDGGAELAWQIPVGGKAVTNLAGVGAPGGPISFAVGRDDGVLRIWSAP